MKNPEEIKKLAYERLSEAMILSEAGKYNGAFYLAGYSLELMLKAKICEHLEIENLFDFDNKNVPSETKGIREKVRIHDIIKLLDRTGLYPEFNKIIHENPILFKTISLLFDKELKKCFWSKQLRYQVNLPKSNDEVQELINLLSHKDGLLKRIEKWT